jgi:GAF domain
MPTPSRSPGTEMLIAAATEALAATARRPATDGDKAATLQRIVDMAVAHLEPRESPGICAVERRQITSPASSDGVARLVDVIQAKVGQGPCLDVVRARGFFRTGNLIAERQFARRVHCAVDVTSFLSWRLASDGEAMTAFNLYSSRPDAFDDTDVAFAAVLAAHAAVAMTSAERDGGSAARAPSSVALLAGNDTLMDGPRTITSESTGPHA